MTMDTQAKLAPRGWTWGKISLRILALLLAAMVFGWGISAVSAALERRAEPAGFARGMLQGALMPCAMPNLLVGRDVTIYSHNNTGVRYKLGYTAGVNSCGAVFFGFFFWRISRWRKWAGLKR
jgi:hypothetical protein